MEQSKQLIDNIIKNAKDINLQRQSGINGESLKKIQQISSTMSVLGEITKHCQSGINFYGKFVVYITNLQTNVTNFIAARDLEYTDWVNFLDSQNPPPV